MYPASFLRTETQETTSQLALRAAPGGKGRVRICTVFCKKKSKYSECQKLLSKKTKHLKLMILAFFSVWENVNTCSSILFLSILNPLSVHSQGVEEEEVHDFNGWLLEGSSILWYGRGHFLSTNRWGGSKKMTIHRPAKEPPPQGDNSGTLSWASSLQDYEMNVC